MPWHKLKPNSVGLAPLAGITDSPFRQLCREYGADFVMSEMISAAGLCLNQKQEIWDLEKNDWTQGSKSLEYARFKKQERPVILQIFGSKPDQMAAGAKILVNKFKPDGIDINMGCPVRKVMKTGSGVALMDKPELAAEITNQVKTAIGETPLSVKTRLGNKVSNIEELAPKLVAAGADALIIHGRLQTEGFSGPVDFKTMRSVVDNIQIPVIANGGAKDKKSTDELLEKTNANGVIIGQATYGNPFLFKEIKDSTYKPNKEEKINTIIEHTKLQMAYRQDDEFAIREMRKHYAWYIRVIK